MDTQIISCLSGNDSLLICPLLQSHKLHTSWKEPFLWESDDTCLLERAWSLSPGHGTPRDQLLGASPVSFPEAPSLLQLCLIRCGSQMQSGSSCPVPLCGLLLPGTPASQEGGHISSSTSSASWAPVTLVPPAEGHNSVWSYALHISAWAQRLWYHVSNVLRSLAP